MAKKIALLFTGQGAQCVGMGRDLAAHHPAAGEVFQQGDEILGRSLSRIAWSGPLEELTKTSNCQPALYVHGLACLAALRGVAGDFAVEAAAGLSLGEWTAHAAAGTFDFATGLKLVETRGRLMDAACAATAGAMAAMIGADESSVRTLAANTDVVKPVRAGPAHCRRSAAHCAKSLSRRAVTRKRNSSSCANFASNACSRSWNVVMGVASLSLLGTAQYSGCQHGKPNDLE